MAKAASKATSLTTLKIGRVEVAVGLFSTREKPGRLAEFTTAGPNGGVLKAEAVARPVPVDELPAETVHAPVHSDPLDVSVEWVRPPMLDPESCSPERRAEGMLRAAEHVTTAVEASATVARAVDGEYGRQLVEDGTGVVVAPQDVRRGVRLEDGRFIDCTEQLREIDERTKLETMEVVAFVDVTAVPRASVQAAYYIGAGDEKAPRALRIIFEGLRRTRRGAVVKLTKKTRQSLGVLGWLNDVLVLYELVWSEDFRPPPARAKRIQQESVSDSEVAMFCELIDAMSAPVRVLGELRDDALALREELYARALAGEVPEVLTPASVVEAQDVLAQLEASLAGVSA